MRSKPHGGREWGWNHGWWQRGACGVAVAFVSDYRAEHLAVLREILAPYPEVREGSMFGYPAFYVGRRMFACVHGVGVGIKVHATLADALRARPYIVDFQPHGRRPMKEWVQINHGRSEQYFEDAAAFAAALRFVGGGETGDTE